MLNLEEEIGFFAAKDNFGDNRENSRFNSKGNNLFSNFQTEQGLIFRTILDKFPWTFRELPNSGFLRKVQFFFSKVGGILLESPALSPSTLYPSTMGIMVETPTLSPNVKMDPRGATHHCLAQKGSRFTLAQLGPGEREGGICSLSPLA